MTKDEAKTYITIQKQNGLLSESDAIALEIVLSEEHKMEIDNIGLKDKDEKGWYIVDESGSKIYLKENKEKYLELAKRYGHNKTLNEAMSMEARHILWKNTDYKSHKNE